MGVRCGLFPSYTLLGLNKGCLSRSHALFFKRILGLLYPARAEQRVLSRSHALFFKRILGLPSTARSRCVLRECGQLPLRLYWAQCVL